jgi:hypothetical protein
MFRSEPLRAREGTGRTGPPRRALSPKLAVRLRRLARNADQKVELADGNLPQPDA